MVRLGLTSLAEQGKPCIYRYGNHHMLRVGSTPLVGQGKPHICRYSCHHMLRLGLTLLAGQSKPCNYMYGGDLATVAVGLTSISHDVTSVGYQVNSHCRSTS